MGRRRSGLGDRADEGIRKDHAAGSAILHASIASLQWRLTQSATRIGEAGDAMSRGQLEHAMERLFEIEPLLFEAERILSALFILAREGDGLQVGIATGTDTGNRQRR